MKNQTSVKLITSISRGIFSNTFIAGLIYGIIVIGSLFTADYNHPWSNLFKTDHSILRNIKSSFYLSVGNIILLMVTSLCLFGILLKFSKSMEFEIKKEIGQRFTISKNACIIAAWGIVVIEFLVGWFVFESLIFYKSWAYIVLISSGITFFLGDKIMEYRKYK